MTPYPCMIGHSASGRLLRVVVPLLFTLVALPQDGRAEPITLTGGIVEGHSTISEARVFFEGPDFLLRVGIEGFSATAAYDCLPCPPGTLVNLNSAFVFTRGFGRAVVDGVTYPEIHIFGMTGTFTTPQVRLNVFEPLIVQVPFRFEGMVSGYLEDPWVDGSGEPAFTKFLRGRGIATALFEFGLFDGEPLFSVNPEIRYDFQETAPIPEPTTMVLSGFGLAALTAWRRRGRGSRPSRG